MLDINKNSNLSLLNELRYQMTKFKELTEELKLYLLTCELIDSEVFQLPFVSRENEHKEINTIPVNNDVGESALFKALRSYGKIYMEDDVSRKCVYRLPGYIQVDGDKKKIAGLVSSINESKLLFKQEVQKIVGSKNKFELVHDEFPGLITTQFYRKLYAIEDDVSSMGFCWTNKFVTYKTTKKAVIENIERQIKSVPIHSNPDEWKSFLEDEIKMIQELPVNVALRIKRLAKVSAALNIVGTYRTQISAHLPVIVVQREPLKVSPLNNFNAAFKRSVRSDSKIDGKPLIERLHLYVKK